MKLGLNERSLQERLQITCRELEVRRLLTGSTWITSGQNLTFKQHKERGHLSSPFSQIEDSVSGFCQQQFWLFCMSVTPPGSSISLTGSRCIIFIKFETTLSYSLNHKHSSYGRADYLTSGTWSKASGKDAILWPPVKARANFKANLQGLRKDCGCSLKPIPRLLYQAAKLRSQRSRCILRNCK